MGVSESGRPDTPKYHGPQEVKDPKPRFPFSSLSQEHGIARTNQSHRGCFNPRFFNPSNKKIEIEKVAKADVDLRTVFSGSLMR